MFLNSTQLTISVVIVNHNGGKEIIKCIDALYEQRFPLKKIFVVDNASTDNSPHFISKKYPGVDLIKLDRNYGPSKARNIGLRNADSDLVLLLDDDVYVQNDCIPELYNAYLHFRPAMICPRIRLYLDQKTVQCDGAEPHFTGMLCSRHAYRPAASLPVETYEVPACIGAGMLVNRDITLSSGGFDESYFFYHEDLEFSLKLRSLGHSILCVPSAVVYHDPGAGTPGLSFRGNHAYPERKVFLTVRNRWMTLLIHYRLKTLVVIFPVLMLYEFCLLAVILRRGWFKSWSKAMASIFDNKNLIMAKRKFIASRRVRRDRDLLFGGDLPFSPGFINKTSEKVASRMLSLMLDAYWRLVKQLTG